MVELQNVVLIGPMGAGKSTIGRFVAENLNFEYLDVDAEIEKSTGADIAWIFDVEGEEGFRAREAKVIESLINVTRCVIATGGGAILRLENRKILRECGYVIYLKTSVESQLERTRKDRKRPLLRAADPEKILREMKGVRDPLYEETAHWVISTDSATVKKVGIAIAEHLITLANSTPLERAIPKLHSN